VHICLSLDLTLHQFSLLQKPGYGRFYLLYIITRLLKRTSQAHHLVSMRSHTLNYYLAAMSIQTCLLKRPTKEAYFIEQRLDGLIIIRLFCLGLCRISAKAAQQEEGDGPTKQRSFSEVHSNLL
jgi:hypothetical protein